MSACAKHWVRLPAVVMVLGMSWACSDSTTGPAQVAAPEPPLAGPGIDWGLSPERITSECLVEIARARQRIAALVAEDREASTTPAALAAVDAAVADMNDALVAHRLLAHVTEDPAVRDASARCIEALGAFEVERSADPALYTLARAAQAAARIRELSPPPRQRTGAKTQGRIVAG